MRDQRELALRCMEVEDAGGSVIEFLHGLGFISASATWQRLQLNELGRLPNRLSDGRSKNIVGKLTIENKKRAVQLTLNGKNPLEYIRSCGIKNAAEAWGKIKRDLKEVDPETFARLPKRLPNPKKAEDAIMLDEVTKAALQHPERPIVSPISPVVVETPEAPKIVKPLTYGDYTVCCIESKTFGRFYWDRDHNHLDWTTGEGEEVSFTPQGWKMFLEELPKVAKLLGVKL